MKLATTELPFTIPLHLKYYRFEYDSF